MTRKFLFSILYAALTLGANPVFAQAIDLSAVSELREGDMKKLVFHSEPRDLRSKGFLNEDGTESSMDVYKGKVVLLNYWATWCAPCREEMPAIDALQTELGGDHFAVVPIATGRNPVPAVKKFFAQINVQSLPILLDPTQTMSRSNGAFGLPTTIILNAQGQEIARMVGDADWHSPEALKILKALLPDANKS